MGRPDIVVKDTGNRNVLILEAKYSERKESMEQVCQKALEQIDIKEYAGKFLHGYRKVICYGVAFHKKQCAVKRYSDCDR